MTINNRANTDVAYAEPANTGMTGSIVKAQEDQRRSAAKAAGPSLRGPLLAGMMLAGLVLGGCDSGDKVDSDLAKQSQELRQRNASLEMQIKDKDAAMAKLQGDNDSLAAQLADARNAAARTPAVDTASNRGSTGFEGIEGVGSSRNAQGEIVVDVAGDVLFDPGSIVLKSTARKTLDRVAGVISNKYSSNNIRVAGHTDSDPLKHVADKYKDNEELSAQRALSVERYLVSKGVSSNRIYAAAFGASQPKSSKASSRRVEIIILGD